ncbi:MAG TPA: gluconeogenesis factor YvcK family protein [Casimicrobiaceae bacterium]|nr:gluconeogenesis factor YvcK family protein [Casimicrobiaceae bacterium]
MNSHANPRRETPHLVIFAGGSGSRAINIALAQSGLNVTRIVPAWDSGGSSKAIRERLSILPVGDIRHALMTMAHGEGRAGDVVKIFNMRLADHDDAAALARELDFYLDGLHPAMQKMEPGLRGAILNYLRIFRSRVGADFDLRRGSVGNFVLAGAYLAHNDDINTAIFVFRKLCSIAGNVWPTSMDNDVQLRAELRNGERVLGQDVITTLDAARATIGVSNVRLARVDADGQDSLAGVAPNPAVLEAIATADVIIFGPGSFYTSVVPHVLVDRVAEAVARRSEIPKIFVGNMLECVETLGLSLNRMVRTFAACCRTMTGDRYETRAFITHVLAHRSPTPFARSVAGRRFVTFDEDDAAFCASGVDIVCDDFEDPWQRGAHQASMITAAVMRLRPDARAASASTTRTHAGA